MHKCNLIIDSCCDLPFAMVDREGVELLKFPYIMGDDEHIDDLYSTTTAHDFYQLMRDGAKPTTAQISINIFQDVFTRALESGIPTVYISFTSGLSGSFDTAVLVRDQLLEKYPDGELYLVDSLQASIAEGLLVYEAINQHGSGLTALELKEWAEEARYFVNAQFMIDDLEALRRGGRIPGSVAYAGSKLDVKPLLTFTIDGKLSLAGVARGRKKGIKQLVEYYLKRAVKEGAGRFVIVGHADCPKDAARLKEMIEKLDSGVLVLEANIGPVIGTHVGPEMLALVFWGRDRREEMLVSDRIARKVKGE